jgi:hypothetical protein
MSRSNRKTPIFGMINCKSEKKDKKIWHSRWRCHERINITQISFSNLDSYQTVLKNQISSTWDMGKDGRQYWTYESQKRIAHMLARKLTQSPREIKKTKERFIHKWNSK